MPNNIVADLVEIPVSDLLLDEANARLPDPQPTTQQATALALAKLEPKTLVVLAEHIVSHGLDPMTLPAVVPTSDRRKRYRVLEGNRRILALKALETPSLVLTALNPTQQRALLRAAARFEQDPIDTVPCVLFKTAKDAVTWISLRHSGPAGGAGLWNWGSEEKDRFNDRHGLDRPAQNAREIVDFLDQQGVLGTRDQASQRRILSNIQRLFSTPEVRERLGIDWSRAGGVVSEYTSPETARVLGAIVQRFLNGTLVVGDIYTAKDRRQFADNLPRTELPAKAHRLSEPTRLADLPRSVPKKPRPKGSNAKPAATKHPKGGRKNEPRTTLIPRSCQLDISIPRINTISLELQDLSIEKTPNACGVLFRVFVELSVDHYLTDSNVKTEDQLNATKFGEKIRLVGRHLKDENHITEALRRVVDTIASGRGPLCSSFTMHQYVHNATIVVNPRELRDAWDEIQPLMEKIWR